MMSEYVHVIFNLFVVVALMYGLFYVAKKFKMVKNPEQGKINIISAISIGTKEKILLVEVNNARLLLGVTAQRIQTLHVFNEEDIHSLAAAEPMMQEASFKEQLLHSRIENAI